MRGTLIAIGGAMRLSSDRRNGSILPEFYRRSGGADARIVILPTASNLADTGYDVALALTALGLRAPAQVLPLRSRVDAYRPDYCAAMRAATGLFITGGEQARLTAAVCGTPFYDALQNMFHNGGTVAGTSAGTAALSALMIAFGKSGALPRHNIAQLSTGLGLIETCIFDQHFRQRNRIGRLLYAVARYAHLLGIGVDEDTAAIIEDDIITVFGRGAVTVIDGSAMTGCELSGLAGRDPVAISGVQLHIFTRGEKYHLRERQKIQAAD